MNFYLKFDMTKTCRVVLEELMDKSQLPAKVVGLHEIALEKELSKKQLSELKESLDRYGIEIVDDQKSALIQKIKDTLVDMVWNDNENPNVTTSVYLAEKLHHSYGYLSNLFSEITFSSIENFVIIQKIERAKQLLLNEGLTLTEISYILNYSSVAHLSSQFKKTTGLTPTSFQKIIKRKRDLKQN